MEEFGRFPIWTDSIQLKYYNDPSEFNEIVRMGIKYIEDSEHNRYIQDKQKFVRDRLS